MSENPIQNESHRRTRSDHASETAEDYVEAVAEIVEAHGRCRLMDLARRFAVSHVTASRIITRLASEGLVVTEPYGPIALTATGQALAARARKRHEVVFQFLLAIGVDTKTAALDAEGIEHHVSPKTLAKMKRFVETSPQPRAR